jgi:hypothetical protein
MKKTTNTVMELFTTNSCMAIITTKPRSACGSQVVDLS